MIMNKLIIPAILGAIVLVAGAFAIMPVQKAQTTHISIPPAVADILGPLICEQLNGPNGQNNGLTVYNPTTNDCEAPPED